MAASMKHVKASKGLLTYIHGTPCKMQHCRRLHHLLRSTPVAVQCSPLQRDSLLHKKTQTHIVLPCRTKTTEYRHPRELYKTLYEKTHPFYKIIKHKKEKYVQKHPLPFVKDPEERDSDVLLHDDEETLRVMGQTYLADKPVDDVYITKHYPPQVPSFMDAMDNLRSQGEWDFSPDGDESREVSVTFRLDGKLDKKKKVPGFTGFIAYPNQFTQDNRVLCIAEGPEAEKAKEAGAYLVIGPDQVSTIGGENGRIQLTKQDGDYTQSMEMVEEGDEQQEADFVDYIVASQKVSQYLLPLKKIAKAKFPTSKKGSIQRNIEDAVRLFKSGMPYECKYGEEGDNFTCATAIGKMDYSNEQLEENLQHIITDISKHKDLKFGPLIAEVSVTSPYLDNYIILSEHYLPKQETEEEIDLAKELEILEKEMEQIRMNQAS